jgi:hypothetical protein
MRYENRICFYMFVQCVFVEGLRIAFRKCAKILKLYERKQCQDLVAKWFHYLFLNLHFEFHIFV